MARIRSKPVEDVSERSEDLKRSIVRALRGEPNADEPVIFEIPAGRRGFFQVIVVWEKWDGIDPTLRTEIVVDAYKEFAEVQTDGMRVEQVSQVLPVTLAETIDLGILPYAIQHSVHRTHPGFPQVERLLKREGALEMNSGPELRLPTLTMAREARDRLRLETRDFEPEVHWQISQQVGRIVDD